MANISFEELQARRQSRIDRVKECKVISVPGGGELMATYPGETKCLTYYGDLSAATSAEEIVALCDRMIYDCCAMLHNDKCIEEFGGGDPSQVVPALFTIAERDNMGFQLIDWLGLKSTAEVKN